MQIPKDEFMPIRKNILHISHTQFKKKRKDLRNTEFKLFFEKENRKREKEKKKKFFLNEI